MDAVRTSKRADFWIEESSKSHTVSIGDILDADSVKQFSIDGDVVTACMRHFARTLKRFDPDIALVAVGIWMLNLHWHWNLKLDSLLQFGESYIQTFTPGVSDLEEFIYRNRLDARCLDIRHDKIEECIAELMIAIDGAPSDTMLAAVSATFTRLLSWNVQRASILEKAHNYLEYDEVKRSCWALRQWIVDDFERHVSRYKTVKLSAPVNATKEFMGARNYELVRNGEVTTKYF